MQMKNESFQYIQVTTNLLSVFPGKKENAVKNHPESTVDTSQNYLINTKIMIL